jgi:hypothetical protein
MKRTKLNLSSFVLLASSLMIYSNAVAADDGERMNKLNFFTGSRIGELAYIPSAVNRFSANDKIFANSLHNGSCFRFPQREIYWLVINHHDTAKANITAFFSISIVYYGGDQSDRLHVYRNENWVRADGRPASEFDPNPDALELGTSRFVHLHLKKNASDKDRKENLKAIEDTVGNFHAYLSQDGAGSWDHSDVFGDSLKDAIDKGASRLSARLMRYTVTAKKRSTSQAVFYLNSHNAKYAIIEIRSPGIMSGGSPVRKKIIFGDGGSCSET